MFYIQNNAWNKIIGFSEHAYEEEKSEIGGMAVVVQDEERDWEITDPVILKQEISAGNTVLEKDALAAYYTKTAKHMGDKEYRFLWWHSHHTMGAFWSATDIKAIDEFNEGDFSFALVVNLKEEYKFRVSVWKPFKMHSDEELVICGKSKITKAIKNQFKELCTKRAPYARWPKGNKRTKTHTQADGWPEYRQTDLMLPQSTKMHLNEIVDDVDELNDEVVSGTLSYPLYQTAIKKLNKKLEDENSTYKVRELPEGQKEKLLYLSPYKFVEYKGSQQTVYDGYNDAVADWWDDDMYQGMVY